jgi:hypothetical protein
MDKTVLPRVVRRRSQIAGWGVFAAEAIAKSTPILEYKGQLISQREAQRRELRYLPRRRIWVFDINRRWARDAAFGGNIARYVNHACRPNCRIEIDGRHIWIVASRTINRNEELTYDYSTGGAAGIQCRCQPKCERVLWFFFCLLPFAFFFCLFLLPSAFCLLPFSGLLPFAFDPCLTNSSSSLLTV